MITGSEPTRRNLAHLAAFRERAMPLFNSQHQNHRRIRWRGIATTAMVELLVLFALAFAVVRYVEWSSAANFAEFMSATKPSASVANHSGEFSTPAQGPQGASRLRSERIELLTQSGSPARIHSRTSYSNATPSGSCAVSHQSWPLTPDG